MRHSPPAKPADLVANWLEEEDESEEEEDELDRVRFLPIAFAFAATQEEGHVESDDAFSF